MLREYKQSKKYEVSQHHNYRQDKNMIKQADGYHNYIYNTFPAKIEGHVLEI